MATDASQPSAAVSAVAAADAKDIREARNRERTAALRSTFRHELNIAYGSHPKQILDIYYPNQCGPAPALIFLHGGAFRSNDPGSRGYVGRGPLEHGAIFVSMGYRLFPDARYPESCEDVELGVRWLHQQIAGRGGDPGGIYLSGISAGATLTAAVALRNWALDPTLPADLIRGIVLFSGEYDYSRTAYEVVDYRSTRFLPKLAAAIERFPLHTIVVSADNDVAYAPSQADELAKALRSRGASVERIVQTDADHFASNRSLADGHGQVLDAILPMMQLG